MLFLGILIGIAATPIVIVLAADLSLWWAERRAEREEQEQA